MSSGRLPHPYLKHTNRREHNLTSLYRMAEFVAGSLTPVDYFAFHSSTTHLRCTPWQYCRIYGLNLPTASGHYGHMRGAKAGVSQPRRSPPCILHRSEARSSGGVDHAEPAMVHRGTYAPFRGGPISDYNITIVHQETTTALVWSLCCGRRLTGLYRVRT